MTAIWFAWRSLVRQPARAALGVFGVAAVGALLFDMLLLSDGLVRSMEDVLDRSGFDIRATVTGDLARGGPRMSHASGTLEAIRDVPGVQAAIGIRMAEGRLTRAADGMRAPSSLDAGFDGVDGGAPLPWTVLRGQDVSRDDDVVVNEAVADALGLAPGDRIAVQARCQPGQTMPAPVWVRVAGVVEFPFDALDEHSIAAPMAGLNRACGDTTNDEADVILVRSAGRPAPVVASIEQSVPGLRVLTNDQLVGRLQQSGFSYFRQISTVLGAVTFVFALLLITVLLTVSVNQRLGEIAALRAIGCSRRRVVTGVLAESALMVGAGGLLSLPLGGALAVGLDHILKGIPGLPVAMHFFVFEPDALVLHVVLLVATAACAAAYPMAIVARLPIATTLRNEVVS
jgi:putative ABC transport system permease protein